MRSDFPLFPDQASTLAGRVDAIYFFLVAVSGFFSLLIFGAVIYFAIKYHHRAGEEHAPRLVNDNLALEIAWTVVPLALTMIMFVWGARFTFQCRARPMIRWKYSSSAAVDVGVQHPDGQGEINELHVPLGQPVKLVIASEDVIHSFTCRRLGQARRGAGRYTTVWVEATKTGDFTCSAPSMRTQHSGMIGRIVVLEPVQYAAWLSGDTAVPGAAMAASTWRGPKDRWPTGATGCFNNSLRQLPPTRPSRHRTVVERGLRQPGAFARRPHHGGGRKLHP